MIGKKTAPKRAKQLAKENIYGNGSSDNHSKHNNLLNRGKGKLRNPL